MNNLSKYSVEDLVGWEEEIRFADIIAANSGKPYVFKATTVSTLHNIEFHIPKRCAEVLQSCQESEVLIKYATEYAEVAAAWAPSTHQARRISTIVGLEINYRGVLHALSYTELKSHLRQTQEQQNQKIQDIDNLNDLEPEFLQEHMQMIAGFRLLKSEADCQVNSLTLRYRNESDREGTAAQLESRGDTKFKVAARLLREDILRMKVQNV